MREIEEERKRKKLIASHKESQSDEGIKRHEERQKSESE